VVELEPLLEAVGVSVAMECPLYAPPSFGASLDLFPTDFLAKLGSIDQAAVAERWAEAMSSPEHTHSGAGHKLSDGWTSAEALGLLQPLVALAVRASKGQQLYLLTEA
jgi:hypothetical protein